MKQWIDRVMNKPTVAHALAANERYNSRLGPQFAAGITYFSVLSMVPILMFSFAALGLTLTVIRPDLMDTVQDMIKSAFSDPNLSKTIGGVVTQAFEQWPSVGVVAALTAAYSGSNWAGNLKRAVRVMWSKEFEDAAEKKNFFLELLFNLLIFLGLLICVVFSVGVATVGGTFSRSVVEWLGWDHVPGIGILFAVLTIALNFVASWILMAFLFMVLPNQPARPKSWLVGTLIGAVVLTLLVQFAGRIMGAFGGNMSASFFGPVIVIMLLFNIIATTILMSAAWVGSADEWRPALEKKKQDKADQEEAERALPAQGEAPEKIHDAAAEAASRRWAATKSLDDLRGADQTLPELDSQTKVSQKVAARGMKVNLGIGYGVGAATGIGIGALIVAAASKLFSRK
ncbi:YhjD/YihY/BrkB family envelope integrity protein [Tessaracoccus flavescens]|nr:YhjD/YihY/BrkB family envelope integrity protein [Tessaracoccus flavescens]